MSSDQLSSQKELIFFAYQGQQGTQSDPNIGGIKKAIQTINAYHPKYKAVSWEEFRRTNSITKEVLANINECSIFVCDVTYFNHNVLFELGYALARNKKLLILLNKSIEGAEKLYKDSIFKDIRYSTAMTGKEIAEDIKQKNYNDNLLNQYTDSTLIAPCTNDIFYVQTKLKSQYLIDLWEYVELYRTEKNLNITTDNKSEISYRPIQFYFQNIIKSKGVLIHFLNDRIENHRAENATNSFLAGVACGLDRNVKLIAPAIFKAPLDYHDILYQYTDSNDLILDVDPWLNQLLQPSAERTTQIIPQEHEHELNLIKLGIGDDVAENEQDKLIYYFAENAAYNAAINMSKVIISGPKGSGKTAINIILHNHLKEDDNNLIVNIKPDPDELEENISIAELFKEASRKSFFYTVWKLIIFSRLLIFLSNKTQAKTTDQNSTEELNLLDFAKKNKDIVNLSFLALLKHVLRGGHTSHRSIEPNSLETLHRTFLSPLVLILNQYFKSKKSKYYRIIIIADNLDRTWDTDHRFDYQAEMINSLIDMSNKVRDELNLPGEMKLEIKNIIFLRTDILEYLRKYSNEKGKFRTLCHEINWGLYPNLLKTIIEKRFAFTLNLPEGHDPFEIWSKYFHFGNGDHPYNQIFNIIYKKPRDIIYFIRTLFVKAIDNGHRSILDADVVYAIKEYMYFVRDNLVDETIADCSEMNDLLYELTPYEGTLIGLAKFRNIAKKAKCAESRSDHLLKILIEKEFIQCYDENAESIIGLDVLMKNSASPIRRYFGNNRVIINSQLWRIIKLNILAPKYLPFITGKVNDISECK
ncbi:P-loop ATPase, Sll1717 family [Turneriella parva]|uniref:Uncharacterized protein n=1 Tax=Turneriella parva (strain ATCC BAA-1111 / DSM 21527 / NCTC 11395 / H) TaxID=869212 RepID=I4B4D5_TURPD|nr:hypothetical protein [Turneriella parva]AFM12142.1 hypothetical protein Turpa_1494 [Turneriella parva DSM 21527]